VPDAEVALDGELGGEGKAEEARRHLDEAGHEHHPRGVLDVDTEELVRLRHNRGLVGQGRWGERQS